MPPSVLTSYVVHARTNYAQVAQRYAGWAIFADSGAFSAATSGTAVSLTAYATWLQQWQAYFTVYCNLDVVYDWQASAANQAALEAEGLHPVPVFHVGSPLPELARLVERYDYICLGGMVPLTRHDRVKLYRWLATCFQAIPATTRVHGLGIGHGKCLMAFPWASTDASTGSETVRFGGVHTVTAEGVVAVRERPFEQGPAPWVPLEGGYEGSARTQVWQQGYAARWHVEAQYRAAWQDPTFRLYQCVTDLQGFRRMAAAWLVYHRTLPA